MKSMKVVSWNVSNFKKIKVARVSVGDGHSLVIGGQNAQGKSSLIDALMVALVGKAAMPAKPVREGADSAEIIVECDDVTIRRRIKPDGGGDLTVTTRAGDKKASPQTWLDSKIGKLGFDPLAFVRETPKAQADALRKLVGLDVSDIDTVRARIYDERTGIFRDGKNAAGYADGLPFFDGAPAAEVSIGELAAEMRAASEAAKRKADLEAVGRNKAWLVERADADVKEATTALEGLPALTAEAVALAEGRRDAEEKAAVVAESDALSVYEDAVRAAGVARDRAVTAAKARAETARAECETRVRAAQVQADDKRATYGAKATEAAARREALAVDLIDIKAQVGAIDVPDAEHIQRRMSEIEGTNAKVRANAERAKANAEAQRLRDLYAAKTAEIAKLDAERAARIQGASYPVAGLGFDAEGAVTYNGIPLSQASQAEQIRVSMAIGLAANPELRLVLVRDASLLDSTSMALVAEMAEKADALVILERVGDADPGAVVIEDGEVVS